MEKYIVLLRGINVSGKNKILMTELRQMLHNMKYLNVQTYIQSGNIILDSNKTKAEICKQIAQSIDSKFGYTIPVIIRTIPEWKKVIENYPFSLENEKIVAFAFLNKVPKETILEVKNIGEDQYKIVNDIVYLYCPTGFGNTKLTNTIIEKKLGVIATSRNLRTTLKLLKLAES